MKKISISEILSAFVFLPPANSKSLQLVRKFAKFCFRILGIVLGMFL
jgi:hypothetical protein